MNRHAASRVARRAGTDKKIGPHTLRHAFITAALDAGVPLRHVQEAASHADPRTSMRYDRGRVSLDRHATYIAAAYLAAPPAELSSPSPHGGPCGILERALNGAPVHS
jgi:integrase/recombinase XerD